MSDEARDPAEALKKHFATMQLPASEGPSTFVMSKRNKDKLEKIRKRVRELRGQK